MNEPEFEDDGDVSMIAVATTLLRNRWRILAGMVVGGAIAVLPILWKPPVYAAKASFFPQNNDPGRSGIANIAGQFGISVPTGNQTLSPDFYVRLLKSRALLIPIVRDTFTVAEQGGRRVPFLELFGVDSGATREQDGYERLQLIITPGVSKATGVVDVTVVTEWPSVSLAIATKLVNGVNAYNQTTRQGQAAAERRFVEVLLAAARDSLRVAEDRLDRFSRSNVQIGSSPTLIIERDRITRDLMQKSGLFTALRQSFEEARIREVRDTPVITSLDAPWASGYPEARGRLKRGLLGMALGGFLMALFALVANANSRKSLSSNPESDEFLAAVRDTRNDLLSPWRMFARGNSRELPRS